MLVENIIHAVNIQWFNIYAFILKYNYKRSTLAYSNKIVNVILLRLNVDTKVEVGKTAESMDGLYDKGYASQGSELRYDY